MINKKVSVCVFIHHSKSNVLPYYVELYINQLSKHFDKVIVLTNNPEIDTRKYTEKPEVEFNYLENKGYDFGMFYRFISNQDLNKFSRLGIVNDSNILFNQLNDIFQWGNYKTHDFWGVIDSYEKPWFSSHDNNYHIQSHFLVLNENAISKLPEFFDELDTDTIMNESDLKKLRRLVIDQWEIGLTQFLINEGLIPGSFINSYKMHRKYQPKKPNLTHSIFHELATEGYPLIKKKVVLENKSVFKLKRNKWEKTINEFGNHNWDLHKIVDSVHIK